MKSSGIVLLVAIGIVGAVGIATNAHSPTAVTLVDQTTDLELLDLGSVTVIAENCPPRCLHAGPCPELEACGPGGTCACQMCNSTLDCYDLN